MIESVTKGAPRAFIITAILATLGGGLAFAGASQAAPDLGPAFAAVTQAGMSAQPPSALKEISLAYPNLAKVKTVRGVAASATCRSKDAALDRQHLSEAREHAILIKDGCLAAGHGLSKA